MDSHYGRPTEAVRVIAPAPDTEEGKQKAVEFIHRVVTESRQLDRAVESEAEYLYDRGTHGETGHTDTGAVDLFTEYEEYPTLTRWLIDSSIPRLIHWGMDDRSVILTVQALIGAEDTPLDLPDGAVDQLEESLRDELDRDTVANFWRMLLLYGVAAIHFAEDLGLLVSGGKRAVKQDNVLALVVEVTADATDEEAEPTLVAVVNYWDENGGLWEVTLDIGSDADSSDAQFNKIENPTVFLMQYTKTSHGEPLGVPGVIRQLEVEHARLRSALDSRAKRMEGASLLMNGQIMRRSEEGESLFGSDVIDVDGAVDDTNIRFVPTNAEDIPHLEARVDAVRREAMQITGLFDIRPTDTVDGQTATAALLDYESSTARYKALQDSWVCIYADLLEQVAAVRFQMRVSADKAQSPLDAARREMGLNALLPVVREIAAADPTGQVFGMNSAGMVRDILSGLASEYKLDRTAFDKLWPTTSEDLQERQDALAQQQAEADGKTSAAMEAAAGAKMQGQAALISAQTKQQQDTQDGEIKMAESVREGHIQTQKSELEMFKAISAARDASKRTALVALELLQKGQQIEQEQYDALVAELEKQANEDTGTGPEQGSPPAEIT